VVSKDSFIEENCSLEEPPLETLVMSWLLRLCPMTWNLLIHSIFSVLLNASPLLLSCP